MRKSVRRDSDFSQLREILQSCLKNLGLTQKLKESELLALWEDIAGPQVAQFTQAEHFKGGVLFVTVVNHVWLQHLGFFKETFIEKLNARLGEPLVEQIFFRCGPLQKRSQGSEESEPGPPTRKELSATETQEIAEMVRPLRDEELKTALQSFLIAVRSHENPERKESRRTPSLSAEKKWAAGRRSV